MKSVISNERVCYVCGRTYNLQKHHIYEGKGRRTLSDKHGFWVYLCMDHHTGDHGVHFNKDLDLSLKREGQRIWERTRSREDFIKTFNRSYL